MLRDLWDEPVLFWLLVGCVVLVGIGIYGSVLEAREWEAFSAAHACKVIGKMSGSSATTIAPVIGGNGGVSVGTTWIPGKTGYQCDDGVTYWR